ncbi:MAG TPA: hypothetical protein VNM48_11305 [Chloroflexota bacterium]|nr:hypothetical protein [Chloroflexota bacterium]
MDVRANTDRSSLGYWLVQGAIGGVIAGLVIAAFLMLYSAFTMGLGALFMPLRMIGGIVLGAGALEPTYPLLTAGIAGVVVHMLISAGFGMIFGAVASFVPALLQSTAVTVAAATVFGTLTWLVDYYVIAPAAGWTWFTQGDPVVGFISHAFFFGIPLGFYTARVAQRSGAHTTVTSRAVAV